VNGPKLFEIVRLSFEGYVLEEERNGRGVTIPAQSP